MIPKKNKNYRVPMEVGQKRPIRRPYARSPTYANDSAFARRRMSRRRYVLKTPFVHQVM